MNLDETIKYYVEKAEDCEAIVAQWKEKATEYRQLAEQLTELKNRREVSEIEKRSIEKCDKCSDVFDCPLYYPWLKE